jgi:hypothetical protein
MGDANPQPEPILVFVGCNHAGIRSRPERSLVDEGLEGREMGDLRHLRDSNPLSTMESFRAFDERERLMGE